MTPQQRTQRTIRQWAQNGNIPLAGDDLATLEEVITKEMTAALYEERQACARIVDEYLSRRIYHPRGIPTAIRQRENQLDENEGPLLIASEQTNQA